MNRNDLLEQLRAIMLDAERHHADAGPAQLAATWLANYGDIKGPHALDVRNAAHCGAYHVAEELVRSVRRSIGARDTSINVPHQEVLEGFEVLTAWHAVIRDGEEMLVHESRISDEEYALICEKHLADADECGRKKQEFARLEKHYRQLAEEMRRHRPQAFKRERTSKRATVATPNRLQ